MLCPIKDYSPQTFTDKDLTTNDTKKHEKKTNLNAELAENTEKN